MRITLVSAAAALALLSVSTSLNAQRADDQIDARSIALLERAKAARATGNLETAAGLVESALVADPRHRAAYRELAEISRQQGLPGKSIRFYREALSLDPNDVLALKGQGEALVEKGAVERAKANLAKIKKLCGTCAEATSLAAVIAKGPPATATAQAAAPKAEATQEAAKN